MACQGLSWMAGWSWRVDYQCQPQISWQKYMHQWCLETYSQCRVVLGGCEYTQKPPAKHRFWLLSGGVALCACKVQEGSLTFADALSNRLHYLLEYLACVLKRAPPGNAVILPGDFIVLLTIHLEGCNCKKRPSWYDPELYFDTGLACKL